ncbi:MAG: hypothetical protein RLY93_10500 [Sumerlaeia bacterium]
MAEITIRLVYNLKSGKKDIYIDLESEPDALPIEHERDHRNVVEKLLGKGILKEDEVGEVKVSRVEPQTAPQAPNRQEEEPPQGQTQGAGR